jgi:hypothetical protein
MDVENPMVNDRYWDDRETEAEREWREWVEGIEADDEYDDRRIDFYIWSKVEDGDIF